MSNDQRLAIVSLNSTFRKTEYLESVSVNNCLNDKHNEINKLENCVYFRGRD